MNIVLWIAQILLALLFMFAGVSKFLMPADEMTQNLPSYLSLNFIYFIGVCEVLGSVGLIVPWLTGIKSRLTPLAACGLLAIMLGATFTTALQSVPMAILPGIAGILCAFVAWGRSRDAGDR